LGDEEEPEEIVWRLAVAQVEGRKREDVLAMAEEEEEEEEEEGGAKEP
jgi:hypothetical protein